VRERELERHAALGAAEKACQPQAAQHLGLVLRVRGAQGQAGRRLALVVADGGLPPELQRAGCADAAAAVHLHDQVVAVGALLVEEALGTLGARVDLGEARVAAELHEAVDVVAKAPHELGRPGQPDERDLGVGEAGAERPQGRHGAEQVAQVERAQDRDPPRPPEG
jgi:hypothetical protein